jgi:glutathione S-transferase
MRLVGMVDLLCTRRVAISTRFTFAKLNDEARALRPIGLALTACDKSVQSVYEPNLRPPEKQREPRLDRVQGQALAAFRLLYAKIDAGWAWLVGDRVMQAEISVTMAWNFAKRVLSQVIKASEHSTLAAFPRRVETVPEFRAFPHD